MNKPATSLLAALAFAVLIGLGCDKKADSPSQPAQSTAVSKLAGTWQNDLMTVKIDLQRGKYEGIAMGEKFEKKLAIVKELGNTVEFTTGEGEGKATILAQFQEDGSLMLTKEGGIPLIMKRVG